jgi:mgtE-like transporter
LISIPVINGIGGNIGTILGARLASGLHAGYIEYNIKDRNMHKNLWSSILLGLIVYTLFAILIYYIEYIEGKTSVGLMEFVSIVIGTGVLLTFTISIVGTFTAFWSFKKGLDPDDMVAPVVTTLGDILGILFLFLFIGVTGT